MKQRFVTPGFQGQYANQAYCKSGTIFPEIAGVRKERSKGRPFKKQD